MAGLAAAEIQPAGVVGMGPAEGSRQAGFAGGHRDHVHVIGHQAIAGNGDAVFRAMACQELEVELAVGILKEDRLTEIAALGDMMPNARENYSCDSTHTY